MSDFAIVNGAWAKLANDGTFLGYLGLTTASPIASKAQKIQEESEPIGLSTDNIPLVCIYPISGLRNKVNNLVYDAMFEVALYSNSSNAHPSGELKAGTMLMGETARGLLHQVNLGGATFKTEFQTSFQTSSKVVGIKKYVMRFEVSEVIE